MGSASAMQAAAAGTSRNAICRVPLATACRKPAQVAGRDEARERREEHRRDRHREHALRQHVDAERGLDGARGVGAAVDGDREGRRDEQVDVDQPEPDRDRQHLREHAPQGGVADVPADRQPPAAPAQPRQRQQELHDGRHQPAPGVELDLVVRVVGAEADEQERDDHEVPDHRHERRHRELAEAHQDRVDEPGQAEQQHDREEDADERDGEVDARLLQRQELARSARRRRCRAPSRRSGRRWRR